jgi:hypothetical protein
MVLTEVHDYTRAVGGWNCVGALVSGMDVDAFWGFTMAVSAKNSEFIDPSCVITIDNIA